MSSKKIGIVVNKKKPHAAALLKQLKKWLVKRKVLVRDTLLHSDKEVLTGSDLIVCLGGDGTLLGLVRRLKDRQIPILGVNLGSLGFLTEVKEKEIYGELETCLSGKFQAEERLMLQARILKGKRVVREFLALNDLVVNREGLSRMLRLSVYVGHEVLTQFAGDGIIVATPTGSTAYSLSAGGAIVHPKLSALIVTPICPHSSSLRSIVVDAEERITINLQPTKESHKAMITADGQENIEIDDSYSVEISKSAAALHLIKSSKRSYIATLRENFKFPT